jgi:spore coat polysaccharide biosynthesis predicted glycosyltransferase SpsG
MARRAQVRLVVIGDGCATPLLAGRGIDFLSVNDEAGALQAAEAFAPDVIVFDLLRFDVSATRQLALRAMTVSLSPIFDSMAEVALMFHRSEIANPAWPLHPVGPKLRGGLQYAVVSSHTTRIPGEVFEHHAADPTLSLAISMGGTDAANKTLRVLEELKQCSAPLLIWLLLGEGYAHSYQSLVDTMQGSHHEIILAKTNNSMWRILHLCSLVLLAAGTTTYEAAYAGIPSINLLEHSHTAYLIEELVQKGVAICAGKNFEDSLKALNAHIEALNLDRARLRSMHRAAHSLLDGKGAERIIEEILAFHAARP